MFSIVAWAGDYLPLAWAIAIVAGMALQVLAVTRRLRRSMSRPESGNEASL